MVTKTELTVYSTGVQEKITCDITLSARGNSNILRFENEKLILELCLKDVVDLEDFHNLLTNKEKKIILHSSLNINEKEYKGLRKVVMKNDIINVSLGGFRIEFEESAKKNFLDIVNALKS